MSTDTFAKGDPSTTELNPQVPVKGKSGRFVPKRKGCFVEREKGVYLYAHWISNYPWLIILVTLAIAIALIALAFTKPFVLDSGGSGFIPRTDELGIRKDSVLAALDYTIFSPTVDQDLPPSVVEVQNSQSGPVLNFIYVKDPGALTRDNGNPSILNDASLQEIRAFENGFQAEPNFTDYCLKGSGGCVRPFSLMNYWYPPNGRGMVMANDSLAVYGSIPEFALAQLVDKEFRYPSNLESNVTQSLYTFGYPLAGFNNSQNQRAEQDALYDSWIVARRSYIDKFNSESQYIDVLRLGQGITTADTNTLLLSDAAWAIAAILFVVVWMVIHTMSFWMALWGMVQILLSFPVAYFFIVVPLNVGAFNTLNMLGIFILLGIGADDAFIMVDRWKQSAYQPGCVSHATRMAWAFKSAAKSMFVTSITTSVSFFINASSTIAPIRIFGIFVGLLILINYVFVITLFPCIVSIWGHLFEDACIDRKIKECTKRHPVDLSENSVKPKHQDSTVVLEEERANVEKMRFIERFFYFKFYPFIRKFRIVILVILLGFFIGMLVMATRLQPAQEPAQFIPSDYPLARALELRANAFNSTPRVSTVNLYYGVEGVDRSGTDPNDPNSIGPPIYDPNFDISSAAAQIFLTTVCDQAMLEPTTLNDQVLCPMNNLRDWLLAMNQTWPSANVTSDLRAYAAFYSMNNSFVAYERASSGFGLGIPLPKDFQTTIRFDNVTGELRLIQMIVNLTLSTQLVAKDLRSSFTSWEEFMRTQNRNAPPGVRTGAQISDRWVAISTEDALFSSAIFGLWTSILVAFGVLLLLTMNIFTTLITMLSIGAVVTGVIGTFVSIGWSLGVIESICLTIVVGLSVDYSAHMGDSYVGSRKGHRHGRTRDMLATIGLSIFSAGITTIVSAFFLFGTTIIFFFRFGVFISLTVSYSFVFALFAMPSMLSLFGPQGHEGNFLWFFRNKPAWLAERLDIPESFPDLDEYNATHDSCGRRKAGGRANDIENDFDKEVIEL